MQDTENDFEHLLAVLNDEELYRVRHRLNKKLKYRLVDIITVEINRREEIWRKEARRGPEPGSP
jgi:hypothetical protein